MPKRKFESQAEGWAWIKDKATCTQLQTLLAFNMNTKLNRNGLIALLELYPPGLDGIDLFYEQWLEDERAKKLKRSEATKIKMQSRKAWNCLLKNLQKTTIAKIKPCCFYEWRNESSGPGQYLVRTYGELKSKICKISIIDDFKDSIKNKYIDIKTNNNQTLEYLSLPSKIQFWETWILPINSIFNCMSWVHRNSSGDEESNYTFSACNDSLEISWSGTFLIA